jgi:sugar lactone lactonase YvrE
VQCDHENRYIRRIDLQGIWTSVVERSEEKRLDDPNDVAVHSDGSYWITDANPIPRFSPTPSTSAIDGLQLKAFGPQQIE